MGEVARRAGDRDGAAKLLREAMDEAERYGVHDARTYIHYLFAQLALDDGDPTRARELCELAHGQATLGTPPPMFDVLLAVLNAAVVAAEGDPHGALAGFTAALHSSLGSVVISEASLAAIIEPAAAVLVGLGHPARAARLHGAADALRGPLPRSVPEVRELAVAEAARAARWAMRVRGGP